MDEKGSTFEDIVDAYLAYLQVSLINEKLIYQLLICFISFMSIFVEGVHDNVIHIPDSCINSFHFWRQFKVTLLCSFLAFDCAIFLSVNAACIMTLLHEF